ncbi:TPA: hypothetical protein F6T53_24055, partial [Escherichia coli]|nr:hypothetical protein [Escherichia coli]
MTDFGGKTSIFSHPVYLFLRKFSLQDSRGGSFCYFLITIAFSISPLIQARYMAPLILMPTFYKCISKKDV